MNVNYYNEPPPLYSLVLGNMNFN